MATELICYKYLFKKRAGRSRMTRGKRLEEREGMRKAHKVMTCGCDLGIFFFSEMEMNKLKRREENL